MNHEAILIMESHGFAPNVRSQTFNSAVWSKLYLQDGHYVDIELKPTHDSRSLIGEVMSVSDGVQATGSVSLYANGELLSYASLEAGAGFHLPIEQAGHFELVVQLANKQITVSDLVIR